TMSKARLDLLDGDDEPSALAVSVLKGMYKSRIGDFNRPGSRIYRPDWRDMILAKAVANGYRKLRKIGSTSGRYPIAWHVDAALYTSDDPTPPTLPPPRCSLARQWGSGSPSPPRRYRWSKSVNISVNAASRRSLIASGTGGNSHAPPVPRMGHVRRSSSEPQQQGVFGTLRRSPRTAVPG